jgi:lipopolysaccharide transport system ATP-binding protein
MSDIAIKVENLTKIYHLYDDPVDRLKESLHPFRKKYHRDFFALNDVSFEIKKGETVGIIGKNGAGKSTLLQVLTGVLNPTQGQVSVKGRVLALLELGAGFNPELTGVENVYFNGALLGASKEEIDHKLDSILEFADIGDFVHQPVKTYSSGMYVRLAFGVIANMDADVLIVDEALSVGDAVFTQKCMRYIRSFQERGTLLFVSHDTGAVQNLCKSALWLERGQIKKSGTTKSVTEAYLQATLQEIYGDEQKLAAISTESVPLAQDSAPSPTTISYEAQFEGCDNLTNATGWQTGTAELLGLTLKRLSPGSEDVFEGGERVRIVIEAVAHQDLFSPILGFIVKDRLGQDLFGENTLPFSASTITSVKDGQKFKAEFDFCLPMLPNGQYVVMASVAEGDLRNHTQHHYLHDAYILNVSSSTVRWGLVGLQFEKVSLEVMNDQ